MNKAVVLLSTPEDIVEVIGELKDVLMKENILIKLVSLDEFKQILEVKEETDDLRKIANL